MERPGCGVRNTLPGAEAFQRAGWVKAKVCARCRRCHFRCRPANVPRPLRMRRAGKVKRERRLQHTAAKYRRWMHANVNILYDVYRSKADPSLRIATAPGAHFTVHVKAKIESDAKRCVPASF